jgi:hypothetical protein
VDPVLAADGVDELLTWLIARDPSPWPAGELGGSVVYQAVVLSRAWTVRLAAGQLPLTVQGALTSADATVSGLADAVIKGDLTLVDAIRAARN